jgi:heme-degrading monooxygenase HmoA
MSYLKLKKEVILILEVAMLDVRTGLTQEFETSFLKAELIIREMPGYISHELQRCIEVPNRYILLVKWETLEDHTVGFRASLQYEQWKQLLHHFYDPFPVVQHFELI